MRLPRWAWWLILAVLVVLAVAAWTGYNYYCHCHCYAQKEYSERWGWPCQLVGNPANMLTLFGVIGVGLGFLFISGQMAQTDQAIKLASDANEHTKQSVDAYVGAERGMVYYDRSRIAVDLSTIETSFKNIGRGPLFVLRSASTYLSSPVGVVPMVDIGLKDDPDRRFNVPIPSGSVYNLGGGEMQESLDISIPQTVQDGLLRGEDLYAIHRVVYDAFFAGRFRYHIMLRYRKNADGLWAAVIIFTLDAPVVKGHIDYRDPSTYGTPPRA